MKISKVVHKISEEGIFLFFENKNFELKFFGTIDIDSLKMNFCT